MTLGQGNGDGKVNAGEQIAILLPDGDAFRAAELSTDDECVDLSTRVSDNWFTYDWVGASAKYSLAKISQITRAGPAGHVVRMRARVVIPDKPNHKIQEATIELEISPSR
jgi:hypothetical protein